MRFPSSMSIVLMSLVAALCHCAPAKAVESRDHSAPAKAVEGHGVYGSIAYDKTNCAWGRSWNYSNQSEADGRAVSECSAGGSHCQVVAQVGPDQCGAVAAIESCGGFGWAVRTTKDIAEQDAVKQCQIYNPNVTCAVKASLCSSQ